VQYGAIFSEHNVASGPTSPANDFVAAPAGTPPTFKWDANGAGPSNRLNRFNVDFYNSDYTTLIFSSPEVTTNEYTPSNTDWETIWNTAYPGGPIVRWVVRGRNTSTPATGAYISRPRSIVPGALDLIFTIDVTGSMWDDIDAVKASAANIVDEVEAKISDWRVAVVSYQDFPVHPYGCEPDDMWPGYPGDWPYLAVLPFSTDKTAIISAINSLEALCGWDWQESVYSALVRSINTEDLGSWRDNVKKVIVPMGDAPPHDPEPFTGYVLGDVVSAAEAVDPASIYPVVIGGDSTTYSYFSTLAEETGGEVFTALTAGDVADAIIEAIETALKAPIADANGPYTGNVGSPITFDASGSYDPDGTIAAYEWDWENDGTYDMNTTEPIITHTYDAEFIGTARLRVTDNDGSTAIDVASVEVTNQPPVALCQNITIPTEPGLCTAAASVNDGSYDPDGDPITLDQSPLGPYSLGLTTVTLTVTDDKVASDSCTAVITVVDQEPPEITDVTASPDTLWPPNHKMVPVTVAVITSDNCDADIACQIIAVASNEPINGTGDGDTEPDWVVTGDLTVDLRAERSGAGDGRVYTITVECTDDSWNSNSSEVTVNVPHDKGKKK
jgi:hypothetical protein